MMHRTIAALFVATMFFNFHAASSAARAVIACGRFGCSDRIPSGKAARAFRAHRGYHPSRDTRRAHRRQGIQRTGGTDAGVVTSKFGATAHVAVKYASRFQAYIDDLEARGAVIRFMGGIRRGRCSSAHLHPCGRALDVCQLRRGVVDRRCHLPPRRELGRIAAAHGLFEGGRWCASDYGHAQLGVTAAACNKRFTVMLSR